MCVFIGKKTGVFLLFGSVLSWGLAFHVAGVPGSELRALSGGEVNTQLHTGTCRILLALTPCLKELYRLYEGTFQITFTLLPYNESAKLQNGFKNEIK